MANKKDKSEAKAPGWIMWGILFGIIAGTLLGGFAPDVATHVDIIGKAFINCLKMMVVPLVITSLVAGVATLGNVKRLGSIGWRTVTYYMITTGIAVLVGLISIHCHVQGEKEAKWAQRRAVFIDECRKTKQKWECEAAWPGYMRARHWGE